MNFSKYLLCDDPFENVVENGEIVGFTIKMCQSSYRGTRLSTYLDIMVDLDGEQFTMEKEQITLTLASGTFTLKEMNTCMFHRWNFCEKGTLFVRKPGGIAPGAHHLEAGYQLRGMGGFSGARGDGYTGGYRDFVME